MTAVKALERPSPVLASRQCPFCGKPAAGHLRHCPYCREALPEVPPPRASQVPVPRERHEIRRGLLYMLMAAVIHFFAGGYSALALPFPVNPVVTVYLSPALFLGGLGLMIYGLLFRG